MVGVARLALSLLLPAATVAWAAGARAAPGAALEDPLTRGRLLLQAGDRYGALREFSRALSDHPDNVDARRAVADVLVELGAPQAAARTLGPGVDIGLRSRLAAQAVRWAAQMPAPAGLDDPAADASLPALQALRLEARSLPVRDEGLERRLLGDLVVALVQRRRWSEALDAAADLERAGPLPAYVRHAQADALLSLRRPEEAIAAYSDVVAVDPDNRDARIGLFYAQVEAEAFDDAFATVDALAAATPATLPSSHAARPATNPDWLDTRILWSQSRRYGDQPGAAWEAVHPLAQRAPAAAYLRLEQGEVAGARGWPRLAHEEIRIAHALAPGDFGIEAALAQAEFDRRYWDATQQRLAVLEASAPDPRRLESLRRQVAAYQDAQVLLSFQPRRAEGGGLSAPGGGLSATVRAFTPPLAERWRLLAAAGREQDEPEGDRLVRDRYGAGVEGRWPDLTVEFVAWSNHALLSHPGADLLLEWRPRDQWTFGAGLQAFSAATPLRALEAGIRADAVVASATHAWSERTVVSMSLAALDFTDGNDRLEGTLDLGQVVLDRPGLELVLRPALYASRNTRRDAPYFNPASDTSVSLTADLQHRLWRRYERSLVQRLQATLGDYRQSGYGHEPVGRIEYEQAYRHDPRTEWQYGVACGWQAYDGETERSLSVFVRMDQRF